MTRFEDMLPKDTEAEWTCGHVGGAVCAECYRLLAAKAHELAIEIERLRAQLVSDINAETEIDRLETAIERLRTENETLTGMLAVSRADRERLYIALQENKGGVRHGDEQRPETKDPGANR